MTFLTELARLREIDGEYAVEAFLVEKAEAIEELVRAVEKIVTVDNRIEANNAFYDMTKALEKLNRSE